MHANTVSADVGPFAIGVLHNHHAASADVAAAVMLMPARRRELEQIDFVAAIDILRDRPAGNFDGLDRRLLAESFFPLANDIQASQLRVQTERQCCGRG